jgi:sigma-54 dependent transcriptional regulator, acetoin dehydrogenase operon transcriptional activator AcoR
MPSSYSRAHVDHVSRVLRTADRAPTLPVPSIIVDSWQRSLRDYHLDPGSLQGPRIVEAYQLQEHRQRVEEFLRIAGDGVSRLHGRVSGSDYCVMLTDTQGCTIDMRVETCIRGEYRRFGMDLGTCWSESEEGTTGVCSVLINQQPVTVHKNEHFRAAFIGITCSAAPIFSPSGELIAVIDASAMGAPDDRRSQHLIHEMVLQSAKEIENAFFMYSTQDLWVLRGHALPGYVDSQPEFLLAWDSDGVIKALNPSAKRLLQRQHGTLPRTISEAFSAVRLPSACDDSLHHLPLLDLHVRLKGPRRLTTVSVPGRQDIDPRMAQALHLAVRVKDRGLPVLLHGETGVGKDYFARQLHDASLRRNKPFVAINCAAIPEGLIESELFGYNAGAFTGASNKGMRGLLQQADGGTLFLDEIGDMPLSLQTRLLRVLSEGEVAPLGSARRESVDIQVVCATHRDLATLVAAGTFREDLYFRLNGARFDLPPLRERSDKLSLITKLLKEEAERTGIHYGLSEAALEMLLNYAWPGNVRQLHHVLRYACAISSGPMISVSDLPTSMDVSAPSLAPETTSGSPERQILIDALVRNRWKPVLAAQELGISRATLYRRVNQHGIKMPGKGSYG